MKYILLLVSLLIFSCQSISSKQDKNTSDIYHGVKIDDKYKYLEDLNNNKVLSWLKKEQDETRDLLDKISNRQRLIDIQQELDEQNSSNIKDIKITNLGNYFYLKRGIGEDYYKLFKKKNLKEEEELIFDPTSFSKKLEGDFYINYYKPSWDGKKMLVSLTKDGEEFANMRIIDLSSGNVLPIKIKNSLPTYGGVYWLQDSSGITYLQVSVADNKKEAYLNTEVVIQKLNANTPKVLFSKTHNPELNIKPEDIPVVYSNSSNEKFVIAAIAGVGPYHDTYYAPYNQIYNLKPLWKPLHTKKNKIKWFEQSGDNLIYLTAQGASNFKICKTSFINPNFNNPIVLIQEKEDEVIKDFKLIKDGIIYSTTKNGVIAKLYHLKNDNTIKEIALPFSAGSLSLFSKGKGYNYLSIEAKGWLNKTKNFIYDFSTGKFKNSNLIPEKTSDFTKNMIVEELTIPSHDGAMVPLSLIYNKNIKKDGNNSTLMVGYGAYGRSITPRLTKKIVSWVSEGGIFAIAHVRGGGEKGDSWYKGGFKETKPNSWKDFIFCTKYLIQNKYTSSQKIGINGGSAGGITVGRAMTEQPDLFKAVILNSGSLNTVRKELGFNGKNNTKEFGTVKDPDEFKWLLEMDSYHSIKKDVSYPSSLIITGMNDSRVAPWHSTKFAKKLKDNNSSLNPILLNVKFKSGHFSSNSKMKGYNEVADVLSFAFWQTGHPDYQLKE